MCNASGTKTVELTSSEDQNPCHLKIVGPTLGFILTILLAVSMQLP